MLRVLARLILRVSGWTVGGEAPTQDRYVFVAAPHSSNWDGFWLIVFMWFMELDLRWLIKDSWTRWPLGPLLRKAGALGIDRAEGGAVAEEIAKRFAEDPHLKLGIAAAGTRRRTDYWKSGFYRIALAADVPVAMGFLDYGRKEAGFGPTITLTGDVSADMDLFRAFYEDKQPKIPGKRSRMRLRAEDEPCDAPTQFQQ
jgi:1-acyl-sn-glycerol-3-phosphate acyltransferase